MDFSESASEDDEAEVRHYSNLHYVDNVTVEAPRGEFKLNPSNRQTQRFLTRRYWSAQNMQLTKPQSDPKDKSLQRERLSNPIPTRNTIEENSPNNPVQVSEVTRSESVPDRATLEEISGPDSVANILPIETHITKDNEIIIVIPNKSGKKSANKKKKPRQKLIISETEYDIIDLDNSDDESVIEVEVKKPKTTSICIDSSDDDAPAKSAPVSARESDKKCSSPAPSLISSTSDDFIQSDYTNLDMSARGGNGSFDFKLHGSDLVNNLPSKTTPIQCNKLSTTRDVFRTPMNQGKRKRSANNYTLPNQTFIAPFTDIYDSESSDVPESVVDLAVNPTVPKKNKTMKKNKDKVADTLVMANVVGINPAKNTDVHNVDEDDSLPSPIRNGEVNRHSDNTNKSNHETGENFDHWKLKAKMPKDRDLWKIDSADIFGKNNKKKNRMERFLNSQEKYETKAKICSMCGENGHLDYKCPRSMCLNCGSSNNEYVRKCSNCCNWKRIKCSTCQMFGHPTTHCPDIWRRYHLTQKNEIPLVAYSTKKPASELQCSGCIKKGHTVNECTSFDTEYRVSSSYIFAYTPSYTPDGVRDSQNENNSIDLTSSKQQANSVKENITPSTDNQSNNRKRKNSMSQNEVPAKNCRKELTPPKENDNRNKEFSRMLLTDELYKKLSSTKGIEYLTILSKKFPIDFNLEANSYGGILALKGNVDYRMGFQTEIQYWLISHDLNTTFSSQTHNLIPSIRSLAIKKLTNFMNILNDNHGNPIDIYESLKEVREKYNSSSKTDIVILKNNAVLFKEMSDMCQALSMILLGQCGFCDGTLHVQKIQEGIKTLRSLSSKFVNNNMKNNLGKAVSVIFSPIPRSDFPELIDQYKKNNHGPNVVKTPLKLMETRRYSASPRNQRGKNIFTDRISRFNLQTPTKILIKALGYVRYKLITVSTTSSDDSTYVRQAMVGVRKCLKNIQSKGVRGDTLCDAKKISADVFNFFTRNPNYC